jgi:hypothetical protein
VISQIDDLQGDEDDIPTLTEIVVPGRVQDETESDLTQLPGEVGAEPALEVEFEVTLDELDDLQLVEPTESAESTDAEDVDLPLPWAVDDPPKTSPDTFVDGVVEGRDVAFPDEVAPAPRPSDESVPLIVAVHAKAEMAQTESVEVKDAKLRALVNDIADGLELRLQAEIALIEQRLRSVVREELDTRLRQFTDSDPSDS